MKGTLDKEQVKELYVQGFSDSEIAKKIKAKKDTVKKCIQRNFEYLRYIHKTAAVRRKEVLRAVNYQANRYMGDSTFVKKNRSIYKTNMNGDIVLNKKVAPVVTWDTPRRLVNENRMR